MNPVTMYADPEHELLQHPPPIEYLEQPIKPFPYDPAFHYKISTALSEIPEVDSYTSLRLSNINPRIPDEEVRDAVFHTFKKFGEINIKFAHTIDRRLVYVNFTFVEDAQLARNALLNKLELFDRLIVIEAVSPSKHWKPPGMIREASFIPYPMPPEIWESHKKDIFPEPQYFQPKFNKEGEKNSDFKQLPPEHDRRATRTLFVGNVDQKMDPSELKKYFKPYGYVEELDIKCPIKGNGNPYAFVRFFNLNMAYKAKIALNGKVLGKLQCKIGYARPIPTTCVWVGNLKDSLKIQDLLIHFEKFGTILGYEWPRGHSYAFIAYDNIDSAKVAIVEMRGLVLPGAPKGLRTDFGELKHMEGPQPGDKKFSKKKKKHKERVSRSRSKSSSSDDSSVSRSKFRRRKKSSNSSSDSSSSDSRTKFTKSSRKKKRGSSYSDSPSNNSDLENENKHTAFQIGNVEEAETILDLARCLPVVWSGPLELKNSTFFTRMHLVSGNSSLVDLLLAGVITSDYSALKINQRLRLDKPKLKEIERRISLSGTDGFCVLLAVSDLSDNKDTSRHKPMANLVSYLKQKNAAGVLSLPPTGKPGNENGLLHTFPPCEFAHRYLLKCAPRLIPNFSKDDYIVVILVKVIV